MIDLVLLLLIKYPQPKIPITKRYFSPIANSMLLLVNSLRLIKRTILLYSDYYISIQNSTEKSDGAWISLFKLTKNHKDTFFFCKCGHKRRLSDSYLICECSKRRLFDLWMFKVRVDVWMFKVRKRRLSDGGNVG